MCVLRVTGRTFDPAKYLASSRLQPYSVFHAGEPKFRSQSKGSTHEESGFKIDVSRRSWSSLAGQAADAVSFLRKHRRALAALRRYPGVDDIRLDFPLDLRIDRKTVFAQFDYFPPTLVSLAGALGCGLEVSIYPGDLEQLARRGPKSLRTRPNPSPRKRPAR
jgi:hypothetical protein